MASATVSSDSTADRLHLDSIPTVDLRLLSQSELYALSLCSAAAFDPRRCDDVVIPKIDRSVFNESAGSRKQTYSRLRLAPRKPETTIPHFAPHLRRTTKSAPGTTNDDNVNDPERAENSRIISVLKDLFSSETNGDELIPIRVEYSQSTLPELSKRKRGRPRKNEAVVAPPEEEVHGGDGVMKDIVVYSNAVIGDSEIVNQNGVSVDLEALANLDDPYGTELKRRTEGLETEEGLLGFLGGLNGQWGSRRKKKRIVDASQFGDWLPKGWKLMLSIKKKEGRVWLFCRRYISPNGRQFLSCKEVSSYLLSFLGLQDANHPYSAHSNENTQSSKMTSGHWLQAANIAMEGDKESGDLVCYLPSTIASISCDHQNQGTSKIENSVDVQVDILICQKCNITFDTKDDLLHHQLSCHRRKRSKFGSSITDGVIINGGKYECQFCHKRFNERNRYNGHVGAHVKNDMNSAETSIRDQSDAVAEMLSDKVNNELNSDSPNSDFKVDGNITDKFDHDLNSLSQDNLDTKANTEEKTLPEKSCDGLDGDYKINDDNLDEGTVAAEISFCLASESALSNNEENSRTCETSGETNVRNLESCSTAPYVNNQAFDHEMQVNEISVGKEEPNQKIGSQSGLVAPNCNNDMYGIENTEDRHFTGTIEENTQIQERASGSCSVVPSLKEPGVEDSGNRAPIFAELSEQQKGSENSLPFLSGYEQTCGTENNGDKFSTRKTEEPKRDEVETSKTTEFVFGNIQNGLTSDFVTSNKQEGILELLSLVPSGNLRTSGAEFNVGGAYDSVVEVPKQGSLSETGIQIRYSTEDTCTMSNISTSIFEEPKFDEVPKSMQNDLNLSFGNVPIGLNGNIGTSVNIEQICGIEPNRTGDTDGKASGPVYNLCRAYNVGEWESPRIDEIGYSGNEKLMFGFGSGNLQPDADVMDGGIWRTNEENVSVHQMQSSSSFHSFDMNADKGENEIFRVNGRYESLSGFEGLRPGSIEHVEFNFLPTQNLNSLPENSNILSYQPEIGQGFDSSFWLEKDALTWNVAASNQVTTVCVWCRLEFQHEPVHTQAGAIGSICPTCSAKSSNQFSLL